MPRSAAHRLFPIVTSILVGLLLLPAGLARKAHQPAQEDDTD